MGVLLPAGLLTVVGISHRSAPVELRERVKLDDEGVGAALRRLSPAVVVSTCNRTEVYHLAGSSDDEVAAFFACYLDLPPDRVGEHLYRLTHVAAARHLYGVAAGLDSLVLGEAQILGQVREALDAAELAGSAGPVLSRVFRDAIRVGKRARAETFIGRHAVSVSYAAVELARSTLGSLAGCRALVIGAGEMGELAARTLADHGVGLIEVANRTRARAETLAARYGGEAFSLDDLVGALAAADIVISSTDAPGYVLDRATAQAAAARRDGRPLVVVDIAVPRDVDPAAREVPGITLYDIDDLKARCDHNLERRRQEIRRVQAIIDAEVERFARWWRTLPAVPAVVALRERGEAARQAELAEALRKLPELGEAERAVIEQLTRALANKLLHEPTVRLKDLAAADDAAGLHQLARALGLPSEEE